MKMNDRILLNSMFTTMLSATAITAAIANNVKLMNRNSRVFVRFCFENGFGKWW